MKQFLASISYIDYDDQSIQRFIQANFSPIMNSLQRARTAFYLVRDHIAHSFDIQASVVTDRASEVLRHKTGICHAKANLLAALLRAQGIPAGFCYQHITLDNDDLLHCYNAIMLDGRWINVDARGNTGGLQAQFSLEQPILAFADREEFDAYFSRHLRLRLSDMPTMNMLEGADSLDKVYSDLPEFPATRPNILE